MDVILLLSVPLLIFSVFTFQQKGNKIIMAFVFALVLTRWVGGLMLLTGSSSLREGWDNMWSASEEGTSSLCSSEVCKGRRYCRQTTLLTTCYVENYRYGSNYLIFRLVLFLLDSFPRCGADSSCWLVCTGLLHE